MKLIHCLGILWLLAANHAVATTTLISNVGQALGGPGNLASTSYRYATDFLTNGSASTITGGEFMMDNLDNINHTFTASIFTDNGGTPGTLVGTFNPFTVPANSSYNNYSATSVGNISLASSTTYWEVMQMDENLGTGGAPQVIYTSSQAVDSGSLFSFVSATPLQTSTNGGASYSNVTAFGSPITGNYQFTLTGLVVPEPSRALFISAGFGLSMVRRRRRQC